MNALTCNAPGIGGPGDSMASEFESAADAKWFDLRWLRDTGCEVLDDPQMWQSLRDGDELAFCTALRRKLSDRALSEAAQEATNDRIFGAF